MFGGKILQVVTGTQGGGSYLPAKERGSEESSPWQRLDLRFRLQNGGGGGTNFSSPSHTVKAALANKYVLQ